MDKDQRINDLANAANTAASYLRAAVQGDDRGHILIGPKSVNLSSAFYEALTKDRAALLGILGKLGVKDAPCAISLIEDRERKIETLHRFNTNQTNLIGRLESDAAEARKESQKTVARADSAEDLQHLTKLANERLSIENARLENLAANCRNDAQRASIDLVDELKRATDRTATIRHLESRNATLEEANQQNLAQAIVVEDRLKEKIAQLELRASRLSNALESAVGAQPCDNCRQERDRALEERATAIAQRDIFAGLIGLRDPDSHPDDQLPRDKTWHGERANWMKEVEGLRGHIKDLETKLTLHDRDLRDACGELLVPLPYPGSDMARVMRANSQLRRERDSYWDKLATHKRDELYREAREKLLEDLNTAVFFFMKDPRMAAYQPVIEALNAIAADDEAARKRKASQENTATMAEGPR